MMRLALLLLTILTTASASPAAARSTPVGVVTGAVTGMSAWGGHVVFSEFDRETDRWSLMHATVDGVTKLRVARQNAPFDADVGTDGAGRPVAVFSRCPRRGPIVSSFSRLPGTSRCRIFVIRLDVAGLQPRLVRSLVAPRFSDGTPTIWRGRIAFGRVVNGGTMAAVFIQRAAGSHLLRRLDRGTIPDCPATTPRCPRLAAPRSMDLDRSRLSFVWALGGGNAQPQENEELWLAPRSGSPARLLDVGGAGECGFGPYSFRLFGQPFLTGRRVSYLVYRGDCALTDSAFTQTGPDGQTRRERDSASAGEPRRFAYDAARDSTGWWSIRGPRPSANQGDALSKLCQEGRCRLVHTDRIALEEVTVRRPPRPPVQNAG